MSTETAPQNPTPTPSPEPTPSPQSPENPNPEGGKAEVKTEPHADLLFGKKPEGEKPEGEKPPEKLDAAGQRKFLEGKVDPKLLEGKTDEELAKLYDTEKAKDDAAKPDAQPFKLEELKLPENIVIDEAMQAKVKDLAGIFNDKGLTQTQKMQKAVDLHLESQQKIMDNWQAQKANWAAEVKSDPVLGGDKLKTSVAAAEAVVAKFGGTADEIKEMQEDLILLGLGNKRSFIRFCNNIHKLTGEDVMDGKSGGGGTPDKKDLASQMWPNMKAQ